ncbi:MAG: nucleotidyltransferase family protein [Faecousia sp.]
MKTVGIICEYNPFHNGHRRQIELIRAKYGEDCTVVCLMSGNYVQRGAPAIVDKSIRARAAVLSGADLVLELPISIALSSAEGFAAGGVRILSGFCDALCFGTETMAEAELSRTAEVLLSPQFPELLKKELSSGYSFPAARQAALSQMGVSAQLTTPNDILGVEYTKAILSQHSNMSIFPIFREGSYHSQALDAHAPSATALRKALLSGEDWAYAVPEATVSLLQNAPLHTLEAGERAIIARLRSMTDEEFERLPYGSEGLWRKLMKAARSRSDLSSIIAATKSKRYTRTRIDRMILCAFLGLSEQDLGLVPPQVRVLAFTDRGRSVLRAHSCFCNAGEAVDEAEKRIGSLYGLFCTGGMEAPDAEENRRIFYQKQTP